MKKTLIGLLLLAVLSLSAGCATLVFERQTAFKIEPLSRSFDYNSADFEVLGPVEAQSESTVILGLVARGTEGYGLLMKEARKRYPDASTVMFIFADYSYEGILYPILGTIRTTYQGTAVRAKMVSQTPNVRVRP